MSPLRTILITGSTDGIGRQTAVELAKNSENHVIIHGRNEQRCQTAIEYIKSAGGFTELFLRIRVQNTRKPVLSLPPSDPCLSGGGGVRVTASEYFGLLLGTNVVDYVIGDFGHMKQVAQMANVVVDRFPKLNVLIANAGVLNPKREISADGLEMTFQVCNFSENWNENFAV